jgi:hypothetical protein
MVQILHLAEEEVLLQSPGMGPPSSSLIMPNDQMILAQCEGVAIAQLESALGVENGLVTPSLEAHIPKGLYIARTLVQDTGRYP